MRRERSGDPFASGMVATGFWTGIAVGRFLLAFLTPKLGEKLAVIVSICTFFWQRSWPRYHKFQEYTSRFCSDGLILTGPTAIHARCYGLPTHILAHPLIRCFRHSGLVTRLLPWAALSSRYCCSNKDSTCPSSRLSHRNCSSFRRRRWSRSTIRRRSSCSSPRCYHLAARHPGYSGILLHLVALSSAACESATRKLA